MLIYCTIKQEQKQNILSKLDFKSNLLQASVIVEAGTTELLLLFPAPGFAFIILLLSPSPVPAIFVPGPTVLVPVAAAVRFIMFYERREAVVREEKRLQERM